MDEVQDRGGVRSAEWRAGAEASRSSCPTRSRKRCGTCCMADDGPLRPAPRGNGTVLRGERPRFAESRSRQKAKQPARNDAADARIRDGDGGREGAAQRACLPPRQPAQSGRRSAAAVPADPRRRAPAAVPAGQRAAGTGPGDRQQRQPADRARDRQPDLAAPLREGLVRTPSDFGMRSDPPTHPELLDYLASRFVERGWSIKRLHRPIMLSSTYQMSSDDRRRGPQARPGKPAALADEPPPAGTGGAARLAAGRLRRAGPEDGRAGGRDHAAALPAPAHGLRLHRPAEPARACSGPSISPARTATNAQRHETTVPQQALFMMNSPFVVEQARHVAARPELAAMNDPARRIRYLYRLLFGRLPTAEEVAMGLRFTQSPVASHPPLANDAQAALRQRRGGHDSASAVASAGQQRARPRTVPRSRSRPGRSTFRSC